jgi:hypothetical protein
MYRGTGNTIDVAVFHIRTYLVGKNSVASVR